MAKTEEKKKEPSKEKEKFSSIKVDGKGNVTKTGGRPRETHGTSDGTMIRHGRK